MQHFDFYKSSTLSEGEDLSWPQSTDSITFRSRTMSNQCQLRGKYFDGWSVLESIEQKKLYFPCPINRFY